MQMEWFSEFLGNVLSAPISSTAVQMLVAFVSGGYITAWLGERWQRRRETRAVIHSNTAQLIRVYQRYTRLLRQDANKRSDQELDFLHADFLAEIKILKIDNRFKTEAEEMRVLAQRMANVRQGQSPQGTEKQKLNAVGRDFQLLLDRVLDKI